MNDYREYSSYLLHYGVKGMKWDHHIYADPYVAKGFRRAAVDTSSNQRRPSRTPDSTGKKSGQTTTNGNSGNTSSSGQQYTGNQALDNIIGQMVEFGNNVANEAEQQGTKAQEAGSIIEDMINNGNYTGAFGYYSSLDDQTKSIINNYVKNNYIAQALGNGDVKLGRQRISQGEKIANSIWNSDFVQIPLIGARNLAGGTVRANENARQITGHRKVTHGDKYSDYIMHATEHDPEYEKILYEIIKRYGKRYRVDHNNIYRYLLPMEIDDMVERVRSSGDYSKAEYWMSVALAHHEDNYRFNNKNSHVKTIKH